MKKLHTLALTVFSIATANGVAKQEVPKMELSHLLTLDAEKVPECVRVSGMRGVGSKALPARDVEAYILESIPRNFKLKGKGKLSVSDKFSNAGKKSIRWDWKKGDLLRIKDLGMLSARSFGHSGIHFDGGINATFTLSAFVENKYPRDATFNFYYQKARANNNWDATQTKLGLAKLDRLIPAGFQGTWFEMSEHDYSKAGTGSRFVAKYDLHGNEVPNSNTYPDNLPIPELNELIIQAPTELESGTIYLDRLIAVAENSTEEKHRSPIGGISPAHPVKPLPEDFKKKIPQSLTVEQQAWIDKLRAKSFPDPSTETNHRFKRITDANSASYKNIEAEAQKMLDLMCDKQPDGSYKFKSHINYNRDRVWFKGDLYNTRKFHGMIPKQLSDGTKPNLQIMIAGKFEGKANQWILQCPESKVVRAFFKSYYDWHSYQVMNAPYMAPRGGKYGYSTDMAKKLISLFRTDTFKDKPEFKKYADYFSRLAVQGDVAHYGIHFKHRQPTWGLEFPHAARVFDDILFEQDDRKLYAMLGHYLESLYWYWKISTPGRGGMIKPDYTYFHHGICSYWGTGNHSGIIKAASRYLGSPFEIDPSLHRTLTNFSIRHMLQGMVTPIKGEQQNPWWGIGGLIKSKRMEDPKFIDQHRKIAQDIVGKEHQPNSRLLDHGRACVSVINDPTREVFDYQYNLDWAQVPASKKFFSVALSDIDRLSTEDRETLFSQYPKLKDITPQRNSHLSFNYSAATTYNYGDTSIACGSYKDSLFIRAAANGYSWVRNYGLLMPLERPNVRSGALIGHNPYGYDYSKVPGTTLPEIKPDVPMGDSTGMINNGPAKGNGSLTFNETDLKMGESGNYAFRIYPEVGAALLKSHGIENFSGLKSYHFYKDKVVALGSDIKADTKSPMQTVLFQEMTDAVPWVQKNHARWNPDKPTLWYNNRSYKGKAKVSASLAKPNYIISPYGHAYLLPGKQKGKLEIEWKKRGFEMTAYGNKGKKEGNGALARILQNPTEDSSHHFCLLINHDGKSPKELQKAAAENIKNPSYKVIKQDAKAHAVAFKGEDGEKTLTSLLVWEPDTNLGVPVIQSANRQMNMMMQKNAEGNLVISICDPTLDYDDVEQTGVEWNKKYNKEDNRHVREIRVVFKNKVQLLETRSGLPESNPGLNAKISDGNVLTFQTRDGVSDTFVLRLTR